MSEEAPTNTDELERSVQLILEQANTEIGGWELRPDLIQADNMVSLFNLLMRQVKSDATRIATLHRKIGALVERAP